MGLDANANKKSFRICEYHTFAHETHWVNVTHGKKSWSERCKITLPANIGPKSTAIESNESSGLGTDRELKQILDESRKIIDKGFAVECDGNSTDRPTKKARVSRAKSTAAQLREVEEERDYYKAKAQKFHADAVHATLVLNQTFEQITNEQHVPINSKVKQAAGLQQHPVMPNTTSPNGRSKFICTEQVANKKNRKMNVHNTPSVGLEVTNDEVKRRTGFPDLSGLLLYIFVVCNGDISLIMKQESSLTWFEEWFMHYEYKWGRTLNRY